MGGSLERGSVWSLEVVLLMEVAAGPGDWNGAGERGCGLDRAELEDLVDGVSYVKLGAFSSLGDSEGIGESTYGS